MNSIPSVARSVALTLVVGLPVFAQSERAERTGASVAGRSVGLDVVAGELLGAGPGYKARFLRGAVEVTPAFGRGAARNHPLTFAFESARLGDEPLALSGGEAEPRRAGPGRVVYDRGAGITERYDLRADGVEQSFVFDHLPAGGGELVVRGLLASELSARPEGAGLRLERDGVGSVTYGGVTGVDAVGRRAPGELRLDGPWLELVLPAEFVATAVLPLVLDPLIGGTVTVAAGSTDVGNPDVAYDATNDVYLVVFEQHFSALDGDVRAQKVDGDGNLVGGAAFIETSSLAVSLRPSVASSTVTDEFFVAWQEGPSFLGPWDVRGRAVPAGGGAPSTTVTVWASAADETFPDVGGEATTVDDDVLVVWAEAGTGIRGRQVTLTGGTPSLLASFTVSTNPDDARPTIAKSGGATGTYAVVWQRFFATPAPGDHDLYARLVSRNGTMLTPETAFGSTLGPDEEDPDVDGDGAQFHVVWEREADADSGDNDVWCRRLRHVGGALVVDPELLLEGDVGVDEIDPAVARLGDKVVVAWADQFSFLDYDLLVRELDPKSCKACGFEDAAALGARFYGRPAMAAARSGDPSGPQEALIVWEAADLVPPFEGDVLAKRIEAFGAGGSVSNRGGGCGGAGTIGSSGPFAVGNSGFQLTLSGADPAASAAILAFNPVESLLPCGSCEWLVWDSAGLLFVQGLSSGGASADVPVPCNLTSGVGLSLFCQWTVVGTSAAPCALFGSVGFSDRLELVIGT